MLKQILKMIFSRSTPDDTYEELLHRNQVVLDYDNAIEQIKLKFKFFNTLPFKERILTLPMLIMNIKQVTKTYKSNRKKPIRNNITKNEIEEIFNIVNKDDIFTIGFTKIEEDDCFNDNNIEYNSVIVFALNLSKYRFKSLNKYQNVRIGEISNIRISRMSNKIAKYLTKRGFGAIAGSPLEGIFTYSVLAERAGLGIIGKHGYIITPEVGTRHRIGVVYTNIENLPFNESVNPYLWIREFCRRCNKCVDICPVNAIASVDEKLSVEGILSSIDMETCFKNLAKYYGCKKCIQKCVFNYMNYKILKTQHDKEIVLEKVVK
ncbi:4Fe-4S dicluster domain-containing protein [Clostridiaceae bacterium M8S5]|nr:4Fe-4S dicluster domain-containing protein [Clostridiaceae bacterium M8S5]